MIAGTVWPNQIKDEPEVKGKGLTSEDDVEDVLDRVGDEVTATAGKTSTLEHIDDVVHHDVHTGQLTPHLQAGTETDTAEDTRLEQIEVGLGTLCALKLDLLLDLSELQLHKLGVGVSMTVQVRENDESFLLTVVVNEPTGRLKPKRYDGSIA